MSVLDTIFDRGPRWLGAAAVAAGGLVYSRRRFDRLFRETLASLRERDEWSRERMDAWQTRRLAELLRYARDRSPFYRERFREAGIGAADLDEAVADPREALRSLPLLTGRDLAEHGDSVLAEGYTGPVVWHRTSGTTGEPLRFALPRELRWSLTFAHIYRFYAWHGFEVGDRRATLGGRYLGRDRRGAIFHNPFERQLLLGTHGLGPQSVGRYVRALTEFQPVAIQGHPSAVARLVQLAEEGGYELPQVRVVVVTGETTHPRDREHIEAGLRTVVASTYGHGEMAVMAAECGAGEGFHVDPFYGYVELVPHPTGHREIVVTSLLNEAMPFIRYRTGDLVEGWIEEPCPCGRPHPRLGRILGRVDDVITDTRGEAVLPVQIRTDLRHAFGDLPPYTLIQRAAPGSYALRLYALEGGPRKGAGEELRDTLPIELEGDPGGELREGLTAELQERLKHWLGADATIDIELASAEDLHTRGGKHKTVLRERADEET